MDQTTQLHLDNLRSADKDLQNQAYYAIIEATNQPVDWAYAAWNDMVEGLTHRDNHVRAISAQVLCNLAKSDPDNRMQQTFPALLNVTKDDRFVTARHCMQNLWKVGAVDKPHQQMLLDGLVSRYDECAAEKNCTLIRYDIIKGMRNLYDHAPDESIREKALALIETEPDLKYRKKYAVVWRK